LPGLDLGTEFGELTGELVERGDEICLCGGVLCRRHYGGESLRGSADR
jgi:hypothetical protein